MNGMCSTTGKDEKAFLVRKPQKKRNSGHLRVESRYKIFLKIIVGIIESISLIRIRTNSNQFFPLALQPSFGPRPTSMKLFVSLLLTRS
jgi:hypothetical protein